MPTSVANSTFRQAFEPLRATVYAEDTTFSGSQMSADLQALEPLAQRIGPESAEMAELLWLQCEVWRRRGGFTHEALQAGSRSLALDLAASRLDPAEQLMRHYWLGTVAEEAEDWTAALHHLQAAQTLIDAGHAQPGQWGTAQKLGLRERMGYVLHESGHYAEALAHNQRLLQDAQTALGASNPAFHNVLNNLAQNAYELKDFALAAQYLQERLRIAQTTQDTATAFDSLFQLGVLTAEQGRFEQARHFFEQRLALADTAGDASMRQQALQDLQHLTRMADNPSSL